MSDEQTPTTAHRFTHGKLSYLQIPAIDTIRSVAFYERLFGWQVDPAQRDFQAPGLIGQWVTDRPAAVDAGTMMWINVDDIEATLDQVSDAGGEVLEPASSDGPVRWLATIRDPAGNVLGIVGHRAP
jgi:predicted enzyme related to lactoylglutathione lyase